MPGLHLRPSNGIPFDSRYHGVRSQGTSGPVTRDHQGQRSVATGVRRIARTEAGRSSRASHGVGPGGIRAMLRRGASGKSPRQAEAPRWKREVAGVVPPTGSSSWAGVQVVPETHTPTSMAAIHRAMTVSDRKQGLPSVHHSLRARAGGHRSDWIDCNHEYLDGIPCGSRWGGQTRREISRDASRDRLPIALLLAEGSTEKSRRRGPLTPRGVRSLSSRRSPL